jgi:hypothetical protein
MIFKPFKLVVFSWKKKESVILAFGARSRNQHESGSGSGFGSGSRVLMTKNWKKYSLILFSFFIKIAIF